MLTNQQKVITFAEQKKHLKTSDVVNLLNISRQHAHHLLSNLVKESKLIKIGSTAKASYALPEYAKEHLEIYPTHFQKDYKNIDLEEDTVFVDIENRWPYFKMMKENIVNILRYSFLEMLNNAIEHSQTKIISIELTIKERILNFTINDFGVGVFKNIKNKKHLNSELEAIQDVMKGKLTTAPEAHSGQGIFFTSKMADTFYLESYDYQLIMNNLIDDIFLKKPKKTKRGTRVSFSINLDSNRRSIDIFKKYSDMGENSDYGFDRTEVKVKLYTREGSYVSRSQARRILVGLDKFESIILDFKKVETVGQAFSDEIFRVFRLRHPDIKIESVNMNNEVKFMVERVDSVEPKTQKMF